jgi:hypothetical protein
MLPDNTYAMIIGIAVIGLVLYGFVQLGGGLN